MTRHATVAQARATRDPVMLARAAKQRAGPDESARDVLARLDVEPALAMDAAAEGAV